MTAVEQLYQLIQTLPEQQVSEVLNFAEFLRQRQVSPPRPISEPTTRTVNGEKSIDPLANLRNSAFIGCINDDSNLAENSETLAYQILSQSTEQPL
jgi:Protein of unknown function (DUF2281)